MAIVHCFKMAPDISLTAIRCLLWTFNILIVSAMLFVGFILSTGAGISIESTVLQVLMMYGFTGTFIGIAVMSLLGCCGAGGTRKCNFYMLVSYAVLLTVLLILEVAACIVVYVHRDSAKDILNNKLLDVIARRAPGTPSVENGLLDMIQSVFYCCGAASWQDWRKYNNYSKAEDQLPLSCCPQRCLSCYNMTTTIWTVDGCDAFSWGCTARLMNGTHMIAEPVAIAVGVFIFIQVMALLMSCRLARAWRRSVAQGSVNGRLRRQLTRSLSSIKPLIQKQ